MRKRRVQLTKNAEKTPQNLPNFPLNSNSVPIKSGIYTFTSKVNVYAKHNFRRRCRINKLISFPKSDLRNKKTAGVHSQLTENTAVSCIKIYAVAKKEANELLYILNSVTSENYSIIRHRVLLVEINLPKAHKGYLKELVKKSVSPMMTGNKFNEYLISFFLQIVKFQE